MTELLQAYWPAIVIALLVGLVIAWYLFHASRTTRVTTTSRDVLDEGASPAARNKALIDSAPAAAVEPKKATTTAGGDDLTRIKGVGPKLAALLAEQGITSFAQIAGWSDADINRIDAGLGRFEGRIRRDDWVGQASLLARGDDQAYAEKYGQLS